MTDLPPPSAPPTVSPFPPPNATPADSGGRRRRALVAAGVVGAVLIAWAGLSALNGSGDEPRLIAVTEITPSPTPATPPSTAPPSTTPPTAPPSTVPPPTASPTSTVAALPPVPTSAPVPVITVDPTVVTAPSTNSVSTDSVPTTAPAAELPSYPVQADGTPVPVEVVFDDTTIRMTGTVPSEAAIERMTALAIANSKNPDATVETDLIINPDVPINVGVRVIELNSPRFAAGSTSLTAAHEAELDRVVSLMSALENVNVLVIGHADPRGDAAENFRLSEGRALSVVSYFVEQGISPDRTSLRAVGEDNPISLSADEAALELNRRTEFVFTGLLID